MTAQKCAVCCFLQQPEKAGQLAAHQLQHRSRGMLIAQTALLHGSHLPEESSGFRHWLLGPDRVL